MKFMNKKVQDLTAWETIKFAGVRTVIFTTLYGAIFAMVCNIDKICDFFSGTDKEETEYNWDTDEEDEELD